jgi:hypothetical protein
MISKLDRISLPLAVVYLNRAVTDSERAGRPRFIAAYLRFRPEVKHTLYVVNKGFTARQLVYEYALFKDLTPNFIDVSDEGFDLEAYRKAAKQIAEPVIFFMNTHSEPLVTGWLEIVYSTFTASEHIGLVGCTGNMETHHPSIAGFPKYPNYHVRSNGFMISKQDYLDIIGTDSIVRKIHAYQLEAGQTSLTNVIQSTGRKALVVGRQGAVRPKDLWRAGIFRSAGQHNLLLADNQTRIYETFSPLKKLVTWLLTYNHLSRRLRQLLLFGLGKLKAISD